MPSLTPKIFQLLPWMAPKMSLRIWAQASGLWACYFSLKIRCWAGLKMFRAKPEPESSWEISVHYSLRNVNSSWTHHLSVQIMLNPGYLKVRQSQNDFLSWSLLQKTKNKNEWIRLYYYRWYLRSTCFCSFFFRGNWKHQKDISKLTHKFFWFKQSIMG